MHMVIRMMKLVDIQFHGKLSDRDDDPVIVFSAKITPLNFGKKKVVAVFTDWLMVQWMMQMMELVDDLVSGEQSDHDQDALIEFSGSKKPLKSVRKGGGIVCLTSRCDGLEH